MQYNFRNKGQFISNFKGSFQILVNAHIVPKAVANAESGIEEKVNQRRVQHALSTQSHFL